MSGYTCPRCETPMQTIQMDDVEVEHCSSCGGICLDYGELDELAEGMTGSLEYSTITDDRLETKDGQLVIACPKCAVSPAMRKIEFLGVGDIVLDRCDSCGVLWLDKNELDQINQRVSELKNVKLPLWTRIQLLAASLGTIVG
jgi:Zn-finger nucleic acid-binding protein